LVETTPAAAYFTDRPSGRIAYVADADVANKAYVDSVAQGLDIKASCLYATTNNITLSGLAIQAGGDWPSALTAGDRILVRNQTAQARKRHLRSQRQHMDTHGGHEQLVGSARRVYVH
jgi:hypothetical protein